MVCLPVLSSTVTVSLVHFIRNLHHSVSQVVVRAAFKQSFSILFARVGFLVGHIPDELHDCECAVEWNGSSGVYGCRSSRRVW